jgi:hypothetical protein
MANQSPVPVEFYGLSCSLSLPVRFPTNFPLQIHSQRDQKLKRAYTSQKKNKKKNSPGRHSLVKPNSLLGKQAVKPNSTRQAGVAGVDGGTIT